jgi:hypothetical protein
MSTTTTPPPGRLSAEDLPAAQPSFKPASLYFVNKYVDVAMIGGLSILVFIFFRLAYKPLMMWLKSRYPEWALLDFVGTEAFDGAQRDAFVIQLAVILMWVGNWPHFAASSYRLYHTSDHIRQYPVTSIVIPWVVLAAVVGSFAVPTVIAPYLVRLYLVWSPYHFSGQSLGITLIYARRAGIKINRVERLALSSFIFGTFISQTIRSEYTKTSDQFYGIYYPSFGLPEWRVPGFEMPLLTMIVVGVMWLGGLAFLGMMIRRMVIERRVYPFIVFLPAVTQYTWFVHTSLWLSYAEFVPFFHSIQYIFIAWTVQLKEKMDARGIEPSARYVFRETTRWGAIVVAGGIMLFFGIPKLLAPYSSLSHYAVTGIIVCGVQIHHFFVDGVIWKLKARSNMSPMMVNLDEMIHGPQPALASGRA